MIDAHLAAAYVIGEPFSKMNEGQKFNFEHSDLTERVTGHLQTVNQKRRRSTVSRASSNISIPASVDSISSTKEERQFLS